MESAHILLLLYYLAPEDAHVLAVLNPVLNQTVPHARTLRHECLHERVKLFCSLT